MDQPLTEKLSVELLARVGRRDRTAFGELYDLTSNILFSVAFRILKNQTTAEDLLQEVYLQVWEKASSYDPTRGQPITWLLTMTRNRAIDRIRSRNRQERLVQSVTDEPCWLTDERGAVEDAWLTSERADAVRSSLAKIPAEQRQAIELAFFRGLTQAEIADALDTPLGTIKARIRRGMLQLREILNEHK
jgi:RNA polymerase sigma-70 factor (ECF subfamily)